MQGQKPPSEDTHGSPLPHNLTGQPKPLGATTQEILQRHWSEQQVIFQRIRDQGMESYAGSLPDLEKALQLRDRILRCMDEGAPGGVRLAGSGILLQNFMGFDRIIDVLRTAEVSGVSAHEECGACKIHAGQTGVTDTPSDSLGQEWSRKVADALSVPYTLIPMGKMSEGEMQRPAGAHIARVAYYAGTDFDPSSVPGLPPGFVINRNLAVPADYSMLEAETAANIALGDHGFGKLITTDPKDQFLLVAVGNPKSPGLSTEDLKAELEQVASKFDGKVRVDGFTPPVK